jgi:CubicO group peptidase (beta-lactamase class C family)
MQWATGFGGATPGVSPTALEDMSQTQVYGYDMALEMDHRSFGTVFEKPTPTMQFGSYQAFGHGGAAGSMLYADPKGEIILGYTVSRFTVPGGPDAAIQPIIDLVKSIATSQA